MIRRAIVEKVLTNYLVKVRIPEVDRSLTSSLNVSTDNLGEMTVCTPPGYKPYIKVGDIVIVSYDEFNPDQSVILGYLFREQPVNTLSDADLNSLAVLSEATLPLETSIGNVKSNELQCLVGLNENVQKQINDLSTRIKNIEEILKQ